MGGGYTFLIHGTISYDSKALFAPENFVFNIFLSKLEKDTGCRLIRCVQKIKLRQVAETGKGDLELQDLKSRRVSLP